MEPRDEDPVVTAMVRRAEVYGRTELLLQDPERELTPAESALMCAGIYCGIAVAFEELGSKGGIDRSR